MLPIPVGLSSQAKEAIAATCVRQGSLKLLSRYM